jgi:ABC-type multidrug transport system ATPase subunit
MTRTNHDLTNISLQDAGKRFNREWIFRHCNCVFEIGKRYAITGPNGSGKSTLLQAIAGSLQISQGEVQWQAPNQSIIALEKVYQYLGIAAPYLELIEEMTAKEFLSFHAQFKPIMSLVSIDEILSLIGLEKAIHKQIRYFSSGMKQRIKLAQAIFSNTPVLLLDEPCTNLDATGYALYHKLIANYCNNKLIIVSSNDPQEFDFCTNIIRIQDYK